MPRRSNTASLPDIINRFRKLHLEAMAETLEELEASGEIASKTPLDILDQISSAQELSNQNSATARYKHRAKFFFPTADLADILYKPDRHINASLVDLLKTNAYIEKSRNVLMISATGCGKTFFSCAFGNNACEHQYTARYFTMTEFLEECATAEERGRYVKYIKSVANTNLIIMDDFLLTSVTQRDVEYLYRLFSSQPRGNKPRSFIICSQIMKDEMYTRLSSISPSLADAIINRISARAYEFEIQGDSMREVDIPAELDRIRESKVQQ